MSIIQQIYDTCEIRKDSPISYMKHKKLKLYKIAIQERLVCDIRQNNMYTFSSKTTLLLLSTII